MEVRKNLKPIIATTLTGLFIKQEPWDEAHTLWYENAAKELNDPSVKEWIGRKDYFKGVDLVMKRLYPSLSDEKRTRKARERFFESVCEYIQKHPEARNDKIVKYFDSLREKYRLALITTNTEEALEKILRMTRLSGLFDIVETSKPEEKDDKILVFRRFMDKYGKPVLYVGGNKKDSFDYCQKNGIPAIFANFESEEEIGVETVHTLKELKEKIKNI